MKLITRSHRSWYGRQRWKWYLQRGNGSTISFSARSFKSKQMASEDARDSFSAALTLIFDHADPDQRLEMYAGYRDFMD